MQIAATGVADRPENPLQLLDLARCTQEFTPKLFRSDYFRDLVYLDVSFTPGSVKTAVQSSLNPEYLPELRILKVEGRELDDSAACLLFRTFGLRLWSLTLCNNKLTDAIIHELLRSCFSALSFQSSSHFETEGKLVRPHGAGTRVFGPFEFIEESPYSAGFHHPERYLADAPRYTSRPSEAGHQEWHVLRSSAMEPRRRDTADDIKRLLLRHAIENTASTASTLIDSVRSTKGGLTHLYLSGNKFTTAGISLLLRASAGRLEHFECDSSQFLPPGLPTPPTWPRSLQVWGVFGLEHLCRPVVSSNLRALRVHHSLVTHIPELRAEGLPAITATALAESSFNERVKMAYPRAFVPDANPRLSSLTLTGIPARSTGPLIIEICKFLELASAQQGEIEESKILVDGPGPSLLRGLRHIRLELLPDHGPASPSLEDVADGTDFDALLDPANDRSAGRSLDGVGGDAWDITARRPDDAAQPPGPPVGTSITDIPREHFFSRSGLEGDYIAYRIEAAKSWTGNVASVPVWLGPADAARPGSHTTTTTKAVDAYAALVRDRRLHRRVGPASPGQVAAGAPPGAYLFHVAWEAMVVPPAPAPLPKPRTLWNQMRDVGDAVKDYRARTRGSARHWTGRLELVRTSSAARYHAPEYWR